MQRTGRWSKRGDAVGIAVSRAAAAVSLPLSCKDEPPAEIAKGRCQWLQTLKWVLLTKTVIAWFWPNPHQPCKDQQQLDTLIALFSR